MTDMILEGDCLEKMKELKIILSSFYKEFLKRESIYLDNEILFCCRHIYKIMCVGRDLRRSCMNVLYTIN